MRKLVWVLFFALVLTSAAADGPSMRILYYGEATQAIMEVYEVEFFGDGMVKSIREYFNPKSKLQSPEEANKLEQMRLESVRTVELSEKGIAILLATDEAEPVVDTRIDFMGPDKLIVEQVAKQRVFEFMFSETSGEFEVFYQGERLFHYGLTQHGLRFHHFLAGHVREYLYDPTASRLRAIESSGGAHGPIKVQVDYEAVGRYTIVDLDPDIGHGYFRDKFEIDAHRVEFVGAAAAVNYLLCPGVHADYLLPFFTHPMVPEVGEAAIQPADDGSACGGL